MTVSPTMTRLDELCINAIRTLSIDAVQKANSGHPGLPLGAAPMAYVLWTRYMKYNPANPQWPDRDRFVLSAGHGSMLLYSLLYLTGYNLPLEELQNFRQWGSITPGHPEYGVTPGVETTTGPLGQGFATAIGMAIAEAHLAAMFNRAGHDVVNHYTYVLASDGDLMEGVSHEAASLAGHLGLSKLICLYDNNGVTLAGPAEASFSEDIPARFQAYGWRVLEVADGNDIEAIGDAIEAARSYGDKPCLISIRTVLGYGSPNKAGTFEAHGSPLGEEEVRLTKEALGWPTDKPFYVPDEALKHMRQAVERGEQAELEWEERLEDYEADYPDLAVQFSRALDGTLPEDWDSKLPTFPAGSKDMATRSAGGQALNAIASCVPAMMGGDADLSPSTNTVIKGAGQFSRSAYAERNIAFGVREHAMGAAVNGMALHGGIFKPYSATFLTFSDYMRPAIRLGALMHIPTVYIFTHDSIGLGEDGPTHQPVEHVAALRAIPGLTVIRPADANETVGAWRTAANSEVPVVLILSRQAVPVLDPEMVGDVGRGGYVLADSDGALPDVILMGTGTETHIALAAAEKLTAEGVAVRVVSMPSMGLFAEQPADYRDSVLPPAVKKRVSIEAGISTGWREWVGDEGIVIGVDRFGASAPWKVIYKHYGLTAEAMADAARKLLGKNSSGS